MRRPTPSEIGWTLASALVGLGFGLLVLFLIGKAMGA